MKGCKELLAAALMLAGGVSFAHDFDLGENEIGDCRLTTLGGYTLAKPESVVLLSEAETNYSVICQIVYKDMLIPHPSEEDWPQMQYTGELLNGWLSDYIGEECANVTLDVICENYADRNFVQNLQNNFPSYVARRIAEMPFRERINVDAVTVTVQAQGEFRRELLRRKE